MLTCIENRLPRLRANVPFIVPSQVDSEFKTRRSTATVAEERHEFIVLASTILFNARPSAFDASTVQRRRVADLSFYIPVQKDRLFVRFLILKIMDANVLGPGASLSFV